VNFRCFQPRRPSLEFRLPDLVSVILPLLLSGALKARSQTQNLLVNPSDKTTLHHWTSAYCGRLDRCWSRWLLIFNLHLQALRRRLWTIHGRRCRLPLHDVWRSLRLVNRRSARELTWLSRSTRWKLCLENFRRLLRLIDRRRNGRLPFLDASFELRHLRLQRASRGRGRSLDTLRRYRSSQLRNHRLGLTRGSCRSI